MERSILGETVPDEIDEFTPLLGTEAVDAKLLGLGH
jgi:hypothetical protein